jgi:hypothetical protein
MIPSDQETFEDADFLDMLNEEIQYFGIPHLLATYEEYLVVHEDFPLITDEFEYDIPERAIGNKLRGVFLVDTTGQQGDNLYDLSRIELEDVPSYTNYNNNFTNGINSVYYVQDNKIIIADQLPFSTGSLRMYFYMKPNTLVEEDRAGVITSIDRITGVVSLSNFPTNFANLPLMDFVQIKSPNKILNYDVQPSSVNSVTKTITFDVDDIPDILVVGDYVNFAQEAIVPQLPTELHPILAQRTAVASLEALGDFEGMDKAQARLTKMEVATTSILNNRVESDNQKIRAKNSTLQQTTLGSYGSHRKGKF